MQYLSSNPTKDQVIQPKPNLCLHIFEPKYTYNAPRYGLFSTGCGKHLFVNAVIVSQPAHESILRMKLAGIKQHKSGFLANKLCPRPIESLVRWLFGRWDFGSKKCDRAKPRSNGMCY